MPHAESVLNQRNKDLAQKSKREIQLGNQWQREQLTVKEVAVEKGWNPANKG
jgi:hypothetical protein